MPSIQCAITVLPSDSLKLSAKIKSWRPQMEIVVTVWHPDLTDIMSVIENKLERGDEEAYAYNVSRWLKLVDSLTHLALLSVNTQILKRMKQVSSAMFCVLLTSTFIYMQYPSIGIALDVMAILFAAITYFFLKRRQRELNSFIAEQQQTFKQRVCEFCQSFQASVADRVRYE